jgi:hypothetical protein
MTEEFSKLGPGDTAGAYSSRGPQRWQIWDEGLLNRRR